MAPRPDHTDGERDKNSAADKQQHVEKIVDELRNVLAGLGKPQIEEPAPPPAPLPEPLPPVEDNFLRPQPPIMPAPEESEKLGEAAFRQAAGLNAPPPSDQEFWNGNV